MSKELFTLDQSYLIQGYIEKIEDGLTGLKSIASGEYNKNLKANTPDYVKGTMFDPEILQESLDKLTIRPTN